MKNKNLVAIGISTIVVFILAGIVGLFLILGQQKYQNDIKTSTSTDQAQNNSETSMQIDDSNSSQSSTGDNSIDEPVSNVDSTLNKLDSDNAQIDNSFNNQQSVDLNL